MALLNTQDGYGALTKLIHWLVVALFAFQFAAANIMLRIDGDETALRSHPGHLLQLAQVDRPAGADRCRLSTAGAQTRPAPRLGAHAQRA